MAQSDDEDTNRKTRTAALLSSPPEVTNSESAEPRSNPVEHVAAVLRSAAHEGEPTGAAAARLGNNVAAGGIQGVSDARKRRDPNFILVALERFVRREPLVCCGLAALSGALAMRWIMGRSAKRKLPFWRSLLH